MVFRWHFILSEIKLPLKQHYPPWKKEQRVFLQLSFYYTDELVVDVYKQHHFSTMHTTLPQKLLFIFMYVINQYICELVILTYTATSTHFFRQRKNDKYCRWPCRDTIYTINMGFFICKTTFDFEKVIVHWCFVFPLLSIPFYHHDKLSKGVPSKL